MHILLILFLVCLAAFAWLWHEKPDLQGAESDPSSPRPAPMDTPILDRVTKRNTERAFLKQLIAHDTSEESCQLQQSLVQAGRDERCIRRAMLLMWTLFMVSLAGLGYCAVLLPDVFHNPDHLATRSLCYLGLGALISQMIFIGYFFWHRAVVRRLHGECRLLVLALAQSRLKHPATQTRAGSAPSPLDGLETHPPTAGLGSFPG